MARVYQICIRWDTLPNGEEGLKTIEACLNVAGDWMRFSAWNYLVASKYNPTQIRDMLKPALVNDHFLVLEINGIGADGWAAPWIWEWIRSRSN